MAKSRTTGGGRLVCRESCCGWARKYLPEYFSEALAPFHRELLGDATDGRRRLMARVAPRGHGKSTCCSLALPLWAVCEQQYRNIVIVSHELSLATQFVRDIRTELETNEAILERYGDLCEGEAAAATDAEPSKGRKRRRVRRQWSEGRFTTTGGVTVQARSAGAAFRGIRSGPRRPDLIICDDIEADAQVESGARRRKLENWLRRVVMPALAPRGRLLVVGSLIHHDSLLANLRDPARFFGWDYRVYRALEAEPAEGGEYRLVALWPERWSVERLEEERRRVGTLAFEQEYQANPIDDSLRAFRAEWLGRWTAGSLDGREDLLTLIAVDPATGKDGGDYFALWVGSVDPADGVIYTRELTLERIGIVEQVKRIVAAFERWRPLKIGIETNAYQVALKQILDEESRRRGLYMSVVELPAVGNKRARIEATAPFYENGTMRLPAALPAEVEKQFLEFPKGAHDDAPDVCAMGIELARRLRVGGRVEAATAGASQFEHREGW